MSGHQDRMVPESEQVVKHQTAVRSKRDVEIGQRIRDLREELGVSTRQFATGIRGLRSSNLSEIERGHRRASSGVLQGIQRKYGASIDWLLSGKDPGKMGAGRILAKTVPVLGVDDAMKYLFKEGEPPSFEVPGSEEFAPAVTQDPRAIQIKAEGPLAIRGIDTLFVEPGREIKSGDVIICREPMGEPQVCRYREVGEGGDVILTNYANPDRPPIVLTHRMSRSVMMYRVSGLFKRL